MYYLKLNHKIYAISLIVIFGLFYFWCSYPVDASGIENLSRYKEYAETEIDGVELDGRGLLERIEKEVCVIGDVLRPFAPFVSYYSALNKSVIYRSKFTPGKFVGYRINSKREIIELYLFGE